MEYGHHWKCYIFLAPTGRIFMKFDIWEFFKNTSRKLNFRLSLRRIMDISRECVCKFMKRSRSFTFRMKKFLDIIVDKLKTHM